MSCLAISPDGSLCASGGKDGTAMLWDLNESKWLYTLETAVSGGASAPINALCFSPNRYWLCAATGSSVKIWVHLILLALQHSRTRLRFAQCSRRDAWKLSASIALPPYGVYSTCGYLVIARSNRWHFEDERTAQSLCSSSVGSARNTVLKLCSYC